MKDFTQHAPYILHQFPILTKQMEKGDVVTFDYDGEKRMVLILNPAYKKKTHTVTLEKVNRVVLMRLSSLIYAANPHVFYETYYRQNALIKQIDGYRTFETSKITNVKRVLYDFGFNAANPNTILFFGGLSIILGYDKDTVYADSYESLNNFIKEKAKRGVYIKGAPIPSHILNFTKEVGTTWDFKSWGYTEGSSPEDIQRFQEEHLVKLLTAGGVFFATDEEMPIFRGIIGI